MAFETGGGLRDMVENDAGGGARPEGRLAPSGESPPPFPRPRVFAFLSETSVTFDATGLSLQREAVERAAGMAGLVLDAFIVEVCPVPAGRSWGAAIRDLLSRARAGGVRAVVVDGIYRFATDKDAALLAAIVLADCNVRIIEVEEAEHLPAASAGATASPLRGRARRAADRTESAP